MKQLPPPLPGRINCRGCGKVNVKGCTSCKRCLEHCGCISCLACSIKAGIDVKKVSRSKLIRHSSAAFCKNCDRCRKGQAGEIALPELEGYGFCGCRSMPKWMPTIDPKASERVINTLARPIGLEVEMCALGEWGDGEWENRPKFIKINIEHDGSVRGAASEAVIWPMVGDQFIEGVAWLNKYFHSIGCEVDDSCGLHVHIGAQDFGPFELRRLMMLYRRIEGDLYGKMLPSSRQKPSPVNGKMYCMKYDQSQAWWKWFEELKTSDQIREGLLKWVFQGCELRPKLNKEGNAYQYFGVPELRKGKYRIPSRYYGLNLHSWFVRGTVEWRHYPGTLVLEEMLYWPLMCGWMVQLASSLRDEDVKGIRGGLAEIVGGRWASQFATYRIPTPVAEWVKAEMKKERM